MSRSCTTAPQQSTKRAIASPQQLCSLLLVAAPRCFSLLLAACCSLLLLAALHCSSLFFSAPCCSSLLFGVTCMRNPQAFRRDRLFYFLLLVFYSSRPSPQRWLSRFKLCSGRKRLLSRKQRRSCRGTWTCHLRHCVASALACVIRGDHVCVSFCLCVQGHAHASAFAM